MAGAIPIAPLPFPPTSYDQRYFNETIRTLNLYFRQIQNPGPVVGSTLLLLQLPTSSAGLPDGTVWHDRDSNVLRIVDSTYVAVPLTGQTATTSTGAVTP